MKRMYFYMHRLMCSSHAQELKQGFRQQRMKSEAAKIRATTELDTANCYFCLRNTNPLEMFGLSKTEKVENNG